jgi:nicotinate phosphoribosyltransferase
MMMLPLATSCPPSPLHHHPQRPQRPRPPTNALVNAMLTDMYQISMAYAYWKNDKHNDPAVFELFFRTNPFPHGQFCIFAGLDEVLAHLHHFCFTQSDIDFLKTSVPALQHCDAAFFDWLLHEAHLKSGSNSRVKITAMRDGTICFPRQPLITIEAPLALGQLLETTLLTLVNYPSLMATNAARMVHAVSLKQKHSIASSIASNCDIDNNNNNMEMLPPQALKIPTCVEFGLRRAQGPDGGMSASKYAQMGGFCGTSNVQAGKLFGDDGIPLTGTHAHAFVQSFASLDEVQHVTLPIYNDDKNGSSNNSKQELVELLPRVLEYRRNAATLVPPPPPPPGSSTAAAPPPPPNAKTNDGELAAFIAYAAAFPHSFLALVDTYDTLSSGLWNFLYVALVLDDLGYKPLGVRLDSGDLCELSLACAYTFLSVGRRLNRRERFTDDLAIVASNDLNEAKLLQHAATGTGCAITSYGIGTNLVTCQAQPALGCVYKLVQLNGKPRIKLSQDYGKILIPGHKAPYRLYDANDVPILDVLTLLSNDNGNNGDGDGGGGDDVPPVAGQAIVCRDAFNGHSRVRVTPSRVEPLHVVVFDNSNDDNASGVVVQPNRTLSQAKAVVQEQMTQMQPLGIFPAFGNNENPKPKPYKVAVSERLYTFMNDLWQREAPMEELS